MSRVGLITCVGGNVGSVRHALRRAGIESTDVDHADQLSMCDRAIVPGVGSFPESMRRMRATGMDDAVRAFQRPLLGICIGMQILADHGDEAGGAQGLGLIPGRVERLTPDGLVRVPHMGWNSVKPAPGEPLLARSDCYFVHSFAFRPVHEDHIAARTEHGGPFVSAVRNGPILGVQFHPEKSQQAGLALLHEFAHSREAAAC